MTFRIRGHFGSSLSGASQFRARLSMPATVSSVFPRPSVPGTLKRAAKDPKTTRKRAFHRVFTHFSNFQIIDFPWFFLIYRRISESDAVETCSHDSSLNVDGLPVHSGGQTEENLGHSRKTTSTFCCLFFVCFLLLILLDVYEGRILKHSSKYL